MNPFTPIITHPNDKQIMRGIRGDVGNWNITRLLRSDFILRFLIPKSDVAFRRGADEHVLVVPVSFQKDEVVDLIGGLVGMVLLVGFGLERESVFEVEFFEFGVGDVLD